MSIQFGNVIIIALTILNLSHSTFHSGIIILLPILSSNRKCEWNACAVGRILGISDSLLFQTVSGTLGYRICACVNVAMQRIALAQRYRCRRNKKMCACIKHRSHVCQERFFDVPNWT